MKKNNDQYVQGKKLSDIFKGNDNALQKAALENLTSTYKHLFFKQVLSFPFLISDADFTEAAEKSFAQTLLLFSDYMKQHTNKFQKNECEETLLFLFKNTYHRNLAEKLAEPEIENQAAASLLQMTGLCKNYLTWYYIDKFTLLQISAVTGQALSFIKTELYKYRKTWQESITRITPFLPSCVIDENRFLLLTDYFANKLPDAINSVHQMKEGSTDAHKNDALELLLRYRIAENTLLKNKSYNNEDSYFSASEFIELAKQGIKQYSRHKTMP